MRAQAAFRYAFERWLQSAYTFQAASDLEVDRRTGGYINPHVNLAWTAFKAGRSYIGPKLDVPAGTPANVS